MNRTILILGTLLLVSATALAGDPFDGTWKINDAKSSWSDGKFPPNMSLTIDVQIDGDVMKYHSVNDTTKDRPGCRATLRLIWTGNLILSRQRRFNQVQIRRIGPGQLELLEMKDGDVIVGAWWWVSEDGKHLVRRGIGKAADGKSKEYEEYFDKQSQGRSTASRLSGFILPCSWRSHFSGFLYLTLRLLSLSL